jgi:ribosomal protein S18 acetylase RimI-like enzyme
MKTQDDARTLQSHGSREHMPTIVGTNAPAEHNVTSPPFIRINHTPGIITITNVNTTIGYCRYGEPAQIEYVFVAAGYRRQGFAKKLLEIAESHLATTLCFEPPFSALGTSLIKSYYQHR